MITKNKILECVQTQQDAAEEHGPLTAVLLHSWVSQQCSTSMEELLRDKFQEHAALVKATGFYMLLEKYGFNETAAEWLERFD